MLTQAGLTITPMDPARLSTVQRGVLGDWCQYWTERVNPKRSTVTAATAQPEAPVKALTLADLAEFNAREAAKGGGG